MYFLRIRPFGKDFKPATSMAGGGGGGGGGGGAEVGALSEAQRQIIAATFNTVREKRTLSAEKLRENSVVLALSQGRLREQVEGLVSRMNSRLVAPDPELPEDRRGAAAGGGGDEGRRGQAAGSAAPTARCRPSRRRSSTCSRPKRSTRRRSRPATRAAAGAAASRPDRSPRIWPTCSSSRWTRWPTSTRPARAPQSTQAEQRIDALAEKLKELARRQQQELERQRRRAAGQAASGGGDQQRALAEAGRGSGAAAREAVARAEPARPGQRRPADAAGRRRDAARRGQQRPERRRPGLGRPPSACSRRSASCRAPRPLGPERDVQDAMRQAEEIAREHADVASDAEQLGNAGADRLQKAQLNAQRREGLSGKLGQLEQQLDRLSNEMAREREGRLAQAAGGRRAASATTRPRRSCATRASSSAATPTPGAGAELDADIGSDLMDLRRKLAEARRRSARAARPATRPRTRWTRRASWCAASTRSAGACRSAPPATAGRRPAAATRPAGPAGPAGPAAGPAGPARSQGQQGQQGQAGQQGQQGQAGQQGSRVRPASRAKQGQQGQAGQQGQQGQSGQAGQAGQSQGGSGGQTAAAATATASAAGTTTAGWGNARPGNFADDDVRQFRGEARRYGQDLDGAAAGAARPRASTRATSTRSCAGSRRSTTTASIATSQELARLQAAVSDGLRRFEFGLRRQLEGESRDVLLSGSDDVPAEFKSLVEEYYRSLARQRGPAAVTERAVLRSRPWRWSWQRRCAASAQFGGGDWGRMRRVPPRLPDQRRQLRRRLQLLPGDVLEPVARGRRPGLVHRLSRRRHQLLDPLRRADQDAGQQAAERRAEPLGGAAHRSVAVPLPVRARLRRRHDVAARRRGRRRCATT